MESSDIKRLALILAVQAEIEGMKVANKVSDSGVVHGQWHFAEKAEQLKHLAYCPDNQL